MQKKSDKNCDFLVIGAGIAGLYYAIKLSEQYRIKGNKCHIRILTKHPKADETNTKYAQGGIAGVFDLSKDSFKKHIDDTLEAGRGLSNKDVVEIVVKEGPERIKEIIDIGVNFDKNKKGKYDLALEGGHSHKRIFHHKDSTGKEIEKKLLQHVENDPFIEVETDYYVIDLITEHHFSDNMTEENTLRCYGCYAINGKNGNIETIVAKSTLLATGGIGQVYQNTTNPAIATGDGIAMAYRARALIKNMEFVQFHPTALFEQGKSPLFLITEAIRGAGGKLMNLSGEYFMSKYDKREELAPRGVVARAIDNEIKTRGDAFVYLDCKKIDEAKIKSHFPGIYAKCRSIGINLPEEPIPVVPAAHYLCGGISTDTNGRTSIKSLYASGECACTELHGANRLASNSLLEALVFAHRIAEDSVNHIKGLGELPNIPLWDASGTIEPEELVLIESAIQEIKLIMTNYVGIVRSDKRLKRAIKRIKIMYEETSGMYNTHSLSPQLCGLRNIANIAHLVTTFAITRKESRGLHYTEDFPEMSEKAENRYLRSAKVE